MRPLAKRHFLSHQTEKRIFANFGNRNLPNIHCQWDFHVSAEAKRSLVVMVWRKSWSYLHPPVPAVVGDMGRDVNFPITVFLHEHGLPDS